MAQERSRAETPQCTVARCLRGTSPETITHMVSLLFSLCYNLIKLCIVWPIRLMIAAVNAMGRHR
jgi:hypothetical protein